jgi:hypothetical protein
MAKLIRLNTKSDVFGVIVREFPNEVHVENYDVKGACIITASLSPAQAVDMARALLKAAGEPVWSE